MTSKATINHGNDFHICTQLSLFITFILSSYDEIIPPSAGAERGVILRLAWNTPDMAYDRHSLGNEVHKRMLVTFSMSSGQF